MAVTVAWYNADTFCCGRPAAQARPEPRRDPNNIATPSACKARWAQQREQTSHSKEARAANHTKTPRAKANQPRHYRRPRDTLSSTTHVAMWRKAKAPCPLWPAPSPTMAHTHKHTLTHEPNLVNRAAG